MLGVWNAENGFNGNPLSFADGANPGHFVSTTTIAPFAIVSGSAQTGPTGHQRGIMVPDVIDGKKGNMYFRSCWIEEIQKSSMNAMDVSVAFK